MANIYDWSLIAANNATSDSGINWAEGQAPSTVNDSARVMMSRIKTLLNDLGGIVSATGTANAIAVTASSGFTTLGNGRRVSFRATNTNTGATTLNVNSISAKPMVKITAYGETLFSGGEIQGDGIYEALYATHLNGGSGAWLLLNPSNIETIPPGSVVSFFGPDVPAGWLRCTGLEVSRATYSRLFAAIGTTWGVGNGTTTFNIPDGRARFLRGASPAFDFGTAQEDTIKAHTHTGTTSSNTHTHNLDKGDSGGWSGEQNGPFQNSNSLADRGNFPTDPNTHSHTFTTDATGADETRPRNLVIHWIIKT